MSDQALFPHCPMPQPQAATHDPNLAQPNHLSTTQEVQQPLCTTDQNQVAHGNEATVQSMNGIQSQPQYVDQNGQPVNPSQTQMPNNMAQQPMSQPQPQMMPQQMCPSQQQPMHQAQMQQPQMYDQNGQPLAQNAQVQGQGQGQAMHQNMQPGQAQVQAMGQAQVPGQPAMVQGQQQIQMAQPQPQMFDANGQPIQQQAAQVDPATGEVKIKKKKTKRIKVKKSELQNYKH